MTRRCRLAIRTVLGLGALALLGAGVVAGEFLHGRPYRWRPVEASLRYNGVPVEGGVWTHGGLYLLELPGPSFPRHVSIDPIARNVSLDNAPFALFGERRTCTLRGVLVDGGAKVESKAVFEPVAEGLRIRITPGFAGREPGFAGRETVPTSDDLIELHVGPRA